MALDKNDLQDIKKLMVETVSPMFEFQNEKIESIEEKLDKFRIETKDHLTNQDYDMTQVKELCRQLEGKSRALQNDIIEILDRVTSIEKRLLHLAESDIENLQRDFARVIAWAEEVSIKTGIPLKV